MRMRMAERPFECVNKKCRFMQRIVGEITGEVS
jgi:hypothetical protein